MRDSLATSKRRASLSFPALQPPSSPPLIRAIPHHRRPDGTDPTLQPRACIGPGVTDTTAPRMQWTRGHAEDWGMTQKVEPTNKSVLRKSGLRSIEHLDAARPRNTTSNKQPQQHITTHESMSPPQRMPRDSHDIQAQHLMSQLPDAIRKAEGDAASKMTSTDDTQFKWPA
jgi:hypothetical protein